MASTAGRLVRTPTYQGQPQRRGMLPISGLMILFALLMFGLALAIPASRAIQEAEMRQRIAGGLIPGDDEQEASNDAGVLLDEEPDDSDATGQTRNEPPAPIEEVSRNSDLASQLEAFRGQNDANQDIEVEEPRKPIPTRIRIPDVEIDGEVHQVGYTVQEVEGQRVREWDVASYAAGHHETSARPGEGGNIVITGHNDWEGEVFRTLEFAQHGQEVLIETEEGEHRYVIVEIHMRREVGASIEERLETGRFMADMPEERLTLITCWPYGINDHRIIVVAVPAD